MGVPQGYRDDYRNDQWDRGAPQAAAPQQSAGGSFLGTAAAVAAGAIGGALLMNGIRSVLGGHQQQAGPFAGAFDQLSGNNQDRGNPWPNAAGSDLAREAGLNDMGGDRRASFADTDQGRPAGLFDTASNDGGNDADYEDDGDFYSDDDTA
jgi:hypothetical protein